jgi:hypothetical protein
MNRTFKELEQLAYMINLPKIAALYAQLDDNEQSEYKIFRLEDKVEQLEDKLSKIEDKLSKIEDICNE